MADNLAAWGRKKADGTRVYVQKRVAEELEKLKEIDPEVHDLLWNSITQGVGTDPHSAGTHLHGWCVDFSFKLQSSKWNRYMAYRVNFRLKTAFACAWRKAGEVAPSAHLHIALHGQANSSAIIAANDEGERVALRITQIFAA